MALNSKCLSVLMFYTFLSHFGIMFNLQVDDILTNRIVITLLWLNA